jgi:hypothetical protein
MQSWVLSWPGLFGVPRWAKYAGLPQTTWRIEPTRVATRLLSGKSPIRMARSISFFLQVDHAVGERDPNVDVRVGFEELDRDGQDMQAAEHDRRGDGEVASRRHVFAGRSALGFTDVFKDPLAGRNVGAAGIGEHEATAGPIDEPCPQVRLEFGHFPADGCERHTELAGRCRKAATFDRREQRGHGFEPVHLASQNLEG